MPTRIRCSRIWLLLAKVAKLSGGVKAVLMLPRSTHKYSSLADQPVPAHEVSTPVPTVQPLLVVLKPATAGDGNAVDVTVSLKSTCAHAPPPVTYHIQQSWAQPSRARAV